MDIVTACAVVCWCPGCSKADSVVKVPVAGLCFMFSQESEVGVFFAAGREKPGTGD